MTYEPPFRRSLAQGPHHH